MIPPLDPNQPEDQARERADGLLEEADKESFPASDPPATQRFE